jgi:hypothetical protein
VGDGARRRARERPCSRLASARLAPTTTTGRLDENLARRGHRGCRCHCAGGLRRQLEQAAQLSDFISKANDLCRKGQAETNKATDLKQAAAIVEKYVKKFKDLKPPDQLKGPYDRFISISEQQVAAAKKNDSATVQSLESESNDVASEMGTQDCISKSQ